MTIPNEALEVARKVFAPLRSQAEKTLTLSSQPKTAVDALRQATMGRLDLMEKNLATLLAQRDAQVRIEEAKEWIEYHEVNAGYRCAPDDWGPKRIADLTARRAELEKSLAEPQTSKGGE